MTTTSALPVVLADIPSCLKQRPQWVCWRYIERDGKPTKCPFNARTGAMADSTDPGTWSTFDDAVAAWQGGNQYEGVGFVFAATDPFCGVDLDDCIDEATGDMKPWGQRVVEALNSYSEISPSGAGVKVFLEASKPGERCRKAYGDGEIEMYDQGRFFTVTGRRLPDSSGDVHDRQDALDELYERVFGQEPDPAKPVRPPTPVTLDDQAIIDKVIADPKYARLWAGQIDGYPSQSEADLALVGRIAFFAGPDANRIDVLFRRSGLCRAKWTERQDYQQQTITKALSSMHEFYEWSRRAGHFTQPTPSLSAGTDAQDDTTDGLDPIPVPFRLTDLGNAQRLVGRHGADLRYDSCRGKWLCWDGCRWVEDLTGEAMRRAKESARGMWAEFAREQDLEKREELFKHASKSEMRNGLESALLLVRSEPGIAVRLEDLDSDPMLLNVLNGTIDLRTGSLHSHDRKDLITRLAPVRFDPQARCPRWTAFLQRILDNNGEMEAYLARIAGLCLTGDASVQEMFIFYGSGANGKSIFLDTLIGLMGDYAGSTPDSLLTVRTHDEHPTEIADLCGKRLVVGSETEQGAKLRIQLIKRLTGNKTLKARYMRQDFFEFRRTHKLILVTNNRPAVKEATHAVWRRLRLVPFTVTIPPEEQDTALLQKLQAEWPGILAWAVQGCLQWQRTGMRPPAEVLAATDAYQADQNTLAEYLAENCLLLEAGKVERTALFCDYQCWCKRTGETDPLDKSTFYDRIRQLEGVVDTTERIGSAPKHVFTGICLCHSSREASYVPELEPSL